MKPKEVESKLQNKFGFQPALHHSEDHRWYELQLPNLPPILTKVSHQRNDLSPNIEGKIARQLRVRKIIFKGMIDCTVGQEDYYQKIRTEPFPPFDISF